MNRLAALVLALVVVFAPAAASAQWSNPTLAPTGGNTAAPINVSGNAQDKVGGLIINSGGATNGLIIPYGRVGIGATSPGYRLQVGNAGDGTSVAANAYFYISDKRLKKNVEPIEGALAKVLSLAGVTFAWKSTGEKSVGLIAQDVEKVFPELVSENPNTGMKSVEYANLVAPLIEAVKEQQAQIEALKAEVEALKANR